MHLLLPFLSQKEENPKKQGIADQRNNMEKDN